MELQRKSIPGIRTMGSTTNDQEVIEQQAFDAEVGQTWGPGTFLAQTADSFTSGGNVAYSGLKYLDRKFNSGPRDPMFSQEDYITENRDRIPDEQAWRFMGTRNREEADKLMADYEDSIHKQQLIQARGGFSGFAAGMMAGIIDIDAPVMLLTGGLSAAAKTGINASRVGALMRGTAGGAAMGLGFGVADYQFNATSEADDIMLSVAFGAGIGTAGGLLGMKSNLANEVGENIVRKPPVITPSSIDQAEAPFGFTARQPAPETPVSSAPATDAPASAPRQPTARPVEPIDPDVADAAQEFGVGSRSDQPSSVGAAYNGQTQTDGPGVQSIDNAEFQGLYADAQRFISQNSSLFDNFDDPLTPSRAQDLANKPGETLGKLATKAGIGNDFARWTRSRNPIKQMMAALTMEDPSGKFRLNQNSAVLRRDYEKQLGKPLSAMEMAAYDYAANVLKKDVASMRWDTEWRQAFDREVQLEMANRQFGRPSTAPQQVVDAANAMAEFYKADVRIGKGVGNELPVEGYQRLNEDPTYQQQKWSGRNMNRMLEDAFRRGGTKLRKQTKTAMERALEADYAKLHPLMTPQQRRIMAKAVVDRAITSGNGVGRDLFALLTGDGSAVVRAAITRQGVSETEVNKIMEALQGSRENRAQPGQTKSRVDVDFGSVFQAEGIEIRMIDLVDNDLSDMMRRRMSRTSGQAALARMGIQSKVDFERLRAASDAWDDARGRVVKGNGPTTAQSLMGDAADALDNVDIRPTKDSDTMWDDLYSQFSGQAVSGGISPGYARLKKMTTLALMNGVGMTSLAEFGPIMAQLGWKEFMKQMPDVLRAQFGKKGSPLMQEFEHTAVFIPDHHIHNSKWNFESEKDVQSGDKMRLLDKALNMGLEAQSHLSAMNLVRDVQQRLAMTGTTTKLFNALRNGDQAFSAERLSDMGFDGQRLADFKRKYIDTNIVEYDADGRLIRTNMDQWDYDDIQYFRNGMARNVDQLVQRAMIGESTPMFHKDGMAQLFFQFKSFPLLALEKQFNRNMRIGDAQSMYTFVYGLLFAGVAYSARQTIAGRTDNLTADRIASGAFNYSNMTGWIPMWADPLAGALGMNNDYSRNGVGSIVSIPASFGVAERLIQAPMSMAKVAGRQFGFTEYDNNDLRNLMTVPIVGQMYGMQWLLNQGRGEGRLPQAPKPKPVQKPVEAEEPDTAVLAQDLSEELAAQL